MKKIAIIGTGIMGAGMAANYIEAGHTVYLWNRSKDKLDPLVALGGIAKGTPREAAQGADIVFEVTAHDESSRSVWQGDDGILSGARGGTALIASATLSLAWIDELAGTCKKQGFSFFDIPVTGGRMGAEAGSLFLLVGGDAAQLEKLKLDLEPISSRIVRFGDVGSGMRFKLLLNTLQAIHLVGYGEVLRVAREFGMDMEAVGSTLAERPGGVVSRDAWEYQSHATHPDGSINFAIQWITKDLQYAKQMSSDFDTPLLSESLEQFSDLLEKGMGDKDWSEITSS